MSSDYPLPNDPDFLYKIYKKREYYYHKVEPRFKPMTQEEIDDYRMSVCGSEFRLQGHQVFLANYINPSTPYRGILIFHGTGSGKTCAAISIAEQFKSQVEKYNTKIYVLLPGPILKEQFKNELVTVCTNYHYIANKEEYHLLSLEEQKRLKKEAIHSALKYYNITSYKNFHRRVLGEKLKEVVIEADQTRKTKYKKTDDGDYEREQSMYHIDTLDNTIIIIDEAHNFTDNEYGQALKRLIKKSKNLKIVLLSATPMKNLPSDIIPLLNFLRPLDQQISKKNIFEGDDYDMKFTENGKEYLQKMATGYISYYKGNNPFTFAERIDVGMIPPKLIFTPLIQCDMLDLQYNAYQVALTEHSDALDKQSVAVSNFVFPGIDPKTKKLTGYYGEQGLEIVKNQLSDSNLINKELNKTYFNNKEELDEIIYISNKRISGKIFEEPYLKYFSIKFYTCLKIINQLKGIGFIYSNLVQIGVKLFEEVMLNNGYLEFKEDQFYTFKNNTRHYSLDLCYNEFTKKYPNEKFIPATYLVVTGDIEDTAEVPAEKLNIIRNFFNDAQNQDGRFIKFVIGSKVVNEGVTLENIKEIHILDPHYHLGRVDQIIGRGIRHCKHFNSISNENPNPSVKIYKYVASIPGRNILSRDEELYRKGEIKYINIKKVERALIEVSVDCPINHSANQLVEDIIKYKDCRNIDEVLKDPKNKKYLCPSRCEFDDCKFKCGSHTLNLEFYDNSRNIYKLINKSHLDYSTFTRELANNEINFCKDIIKDLFRLKDFYSFNEFKKIIQDRYIKKDLFDVFFLYQALDLLIPESLNDLINFEDYIYNKFNVLGYLIYRNNFYIFQPINEKQIITVQYRSNYNDKLIGNLTLSKYIKGFYGDFYTKNNQENLTEYDFNSTDFYYSNRQENEYVGIIDRPANLQKLIKTSTPVSDIFKLRHSIKKSKNKRETTKGVICKTFAEKTKLFNISKKYIKFDDTINRQELCELLKEHFLNLEKYSEDNTTYVIIPYNHPKYPFPYNLKDRVQYINDILEVPVLSVKKMIHNKPTYTLTVKDNADLDTQILKKYNFIKENNKWTTILS